MVESGGHGLLTFRRQDLIVVSPGVPMDTPEVKQVIGVWAAGDWGAGAGEPVSAGAGGGDYGVEWEDDDYDAGGEDILRMRRADAGGREYWAAGDRPGGKEYALRRVSVLEVSSFQLETVEEFHPWIAVILNITPDHLDRHGSFESYAAAKARIFERQDADDFLVSEWGRQVDADDRGAGRRARCYWFSATKAVRRGAFVRMGRLSGWRRRAE